LKNPQDSAGFSDKRKVLRMIPGTTFHRGLARSPGFAHFDVCIWLSPQFFRFYLPIPPNSQKFLLLVGLSLIPLVFFPGCVSSCVNYNWLFTSVGGGISLVSQKIKTFGS
jgi:hypothetical protein